MSIFRTLFTLLVGVWPAQIGWAQVSKPPSPPETTKMAVQANNDFACDLLRELAKENRTATFSCPPGRSAAPWE